MLGNSRHNIAILEKLRKLGVRISLDDFGTGFSGFGYFRAFQFDKVKIDQCFVREMIRQSRKPGDSAGGDRPGRQPWNTGRPRRGWRARAIGASGVSEGCNEVQGFLFSAPQPNAALQDIIQQISDRR